MSPGTAAVEFYDFFSVLLYTYQFTFRQYFWELNTDFKSFGYMTHGLHKLLKCLVSSSCYVLAK